MKEEYYSEAMVSPAPKYMLAHASIHSARAMVDQMEATDGVPWQTDASGLKDGQSAADPPSSTVLVCVCVLDIDSFGVPASIKGMLQAKIDRMEEMDKTVVKTASILGFRFTRKMFKHLLGVSACRQTRKHSESDALDHSDHKVYAVLYIQLHLRSKCSTTTGTLITLLLIPSSILIVNGCIPS
jgi:hypothetical protein